jgi:hypothetical protein
MCGFGQGSVAREKGPSLGSGWIFDFFEAVRGVGWAHLGRGVLDLEELEDRGAVVGDGDVTDVVHEHLIQPDGAQGGLHDVRHRLNRHHCGRRERKGRQRAGQRSASERGDAFVR